MGFSRKESACNTRGTRDVGSISGSGRSPGVENGHQLQYSCLGNSMDRGIWWAASMELQRVRHDWAHTLTRYSNFLVVVIFFLYLFIYFFISWRLITSQYCSGFCHTLTWISHGYTCIPHPDPPSHLPLHRSLWVFPVHQVQALVSNLKKKKDTT